VAQSSSVGYSGPRSNHGNVLTVRQLIGASQTSSKDRSADQTSASVTPGNLSHSQNLSQINALEEQLVRERKQEIEQNFEFNIVLLGGQGVGKTSLLRKITATV